MEVLENALFLDQVPPIWTARAYPSLLGLTSWFVDLLMRLRELETWSTDFVVSASNRLHSMNGRLIRIPFTATVVRVVGRLFQSPIAVDGNHAEYSASQ